MLKIIVIILTTITFSLNASAQIFKLVEIETNSICDLSPEEAWNTVQVWENLNKRVPKVVASTISQGNGLDSSWEITLTNGSQINEKMVYFNSAERTMSYIMTETPMPIKDYVAVIKVENYGVSKSLISFYTKCSTSEENFDQISNAFKSFQETYLSNLKK